MKVILSADEWYPVWGYVAAEKYPDTNSVEVLDEVIKAYDDAMQAFDIAETALKKYGR